MKAAVRQVVLDTETTGLSAEAGERIIEIGCVELIGRKPTGHYLHFYLNPERASQEGALAVHGIQDAFLLDKPKFAEVAEQIEQYLRGAELIIHNAPFDLGFLNREFSLVGKPPVVEWVAGVLDSLVLAKELFPGKRNSLDALCDRLDVDRSSRVKHGALLDAELLADVYIQMTRGQEALLADDEPAKVSAQAVQARDLSALVLPVLQANTAECAAHEALLEALDKASAGQTIWRQGRDYTAAA